VLAICVKRAGTALHCSVPCLCLLAEEVESAKASGMEWLIESTCKSLWDAVDLLIGLAVWV